MAKLSPTIHRIHIEKFRAIQHPLDIDLTQPRGGAVKTFVLAGVNGSGKTSVLEAVLLGLGCDALILRDVDKDAREQSHRANVPEGARIELDVSLDGGAQETWFRTAGQKLRKGRPDGPLVPLPSQELAVEYVSSWRAPQLVGAVTPLGQGRRPNNNETNRLWRLKQRIIDERSRRGFPRPGEAPPNDETWLARLNDAWTDLHEGDGTSIDAQIVNPDEGDLRADLFVMKNGGRVCSIDEISSGEIEIVSLLGFIVTQQFDAGLLLIDEPELHLHPRWQSGILRAFHKLAPEAQFIVATHADGPWTHALSFERRLLKPFYPEHHGGAPEEAEG